MVNPNNICIFEKIKDINYRTEFIEYKSTRTDDDDIRMRTEEYILSDKCAEDIARLQNGDYYFSIPLKRTVPKSCSNRKRIIYRFLDEETALMRLMSYALQEMDYLFVDGLYSFRRGRGAKDYFKKHGGVLPEEGTYAVKADVRSYGNSLNIEILTNMVKEIFRDDPQFMDFLVWLLNRRLYVDHGETVHGDTAGLPGCPIHNFFTNIYLTEADRYFEHRCISYARYSDDILMYVDSKEAAEEVFAVLSQIVSDLKLQFNENKTGIYSSDEPIEFLGMEIDSSNIDIAPTSIYKLKRKMRIRAKRIAKQKRIRNMSADEAGRRIIMLNSNTFTGMDKDVRMSWIRWAFPIITKTDGLRELDLYNQYCIRYAMTDKWSKSQYRVTYEKLKELGYESLVRLYYSKKEEGSF